MALRVLSTLFSNVCQHCQARLTEKGHNFGWNNGYHEVFQTLKRHLISALILNYPFPNGRFVADADASNVGTGGVLSQLQNEHGRVIRYFSEVQSKAKRDYCVTRCELLAILTCEQ